MAGAVALRDTEGAPIDALRNDIYRDAWDPRSLPVRVFERHVLSVFSRVFALAWESTGLSMGRRFPVSALLACGCTVLLNMAQVGIVPWFADTIAKHGIVGFYVSALNEHGQSYVACTAGVWAHSGGTDSQGCHMEQKTGIRHSH